MTHLPRWNRSSGKKKRGGVVSSADGPEKGRETEDLRSKSVSSPHRRETARCEQPQHDKEEARRRREQRGWTGAAALCEYKW